MGVRIQELPETTGINKEDLLIVEDGQGTKKGTVQQLDDSLGVSRLREEFEASQVQSTKDELANQKFLTEYVACMAGIELPVDEEETEEMNHVQDFE
jgi:hypothetical protein